ncbi:MAG: hypothetical protein ACKOFW_23665 [Planctomycetaceae bacterium]
MPTAVCAQRLFLLVCACGALVAPARGSDLRQTPVVKAVERAQAAVVNIHSERTQLVRDSAFESGGDRKLNGMGTGVELKSTIPKMGCSPSLVKRKEKL